MYSVISQEKDKTISPLLELNQFPFKMKVLESNRKTLWLLGMCLERDATQRDYYLSALKNWFVLIILSICIGGSARFFYENYENNLIEAMPALIMVVGVSETAGIYATFIWNKNDVSDFFKELQDFVNESK